MTVRTIAGGTWNSGSHVLASPLGHRRLSPACAWLLNYLWKRGVVSRDQLMAAYGSGKRDTLDPSSIDVMITRLRQFLAEVIPEASIRNTFGEGWQLVAERDDVPRCPHCGKPIYSEPEE